MLYRNKLLLLASPLLLAGCGGGGSGGQMASGILGQQGQTSAKTGSGSQASSAAVVLETSLSIGGRITAPNPQIDCTDKCSQSVNYGTSVVLTATPASGYAFVGWGGACTGKATTCTLSLTKKRQAYASFRALTPAKPGPTNTGVPAGTTLTPSGSLSIRTAGTVIDGLDIDGCVTVDAKNVVIRRSRIRCDSDYPVRVGDVASLLIEDVEIEGLNESATSGIAFDNYVARRINVHGTDDGLKVGVNNVIEDSWIHDLWMAQGAHADGVQSVGAFNVVLRNNVIDITDHGRGHGGEGNSALMAGTEWSANKDWVIEGNWFIGGGWTVRWDSGNGTNNAFRNNRIGRGEGYPFFGPVAWEGQGTFANNVWDDTGELIPLG